MTRPLAVAAALVALGCVPPDGAADAGRTDGAIGGALVRVAFEASEEGRPAVWELASAFVTLAEVRVDNDRGPGFEPMWEAPGRIRLDEDPAARDLDGPPATYGGVTLVSAGGDAPTLELTWGVGEETVELVSARPFEVVTRCIGGGVGLSPGGEIAIDPVLDVGAIARALAAAPLPPASGGVVRVDADQAPEALAAAEGAFTASWVTSCSGGDG